MSESPRQRQERLQRLKQHADALLDTHAQNPASTPESLQVAKLLEDLRVYQVELEVQNEELRRAQQDAELARSRYQSLFEQTPLPAVVLDARGAVAQCNARAAALLGPAAAYTTWDNRVFDRLARDDRMRLHAALHDFVPGQPMVLPKLSLEDAQHESRTLDAHLIQLSSDFHLDRHVLLLLVDRTAEVARDKERGFYSELLESSDSFIYAVDVQGRLLLANRALLTFVGRAPDDVIGHRREHFLPLRDAAMHFESDLKVLRSGEPLTVEEQVHLTGPQGPLEFVTRKFPLRDSDGRLYGVGAISTDVTAIRIDHEQARLSESVFMMASEAIIVIDPEARIERVNPAFTTQSGFSEDAVLGHLAGFIKSGSQDEMAYQSMWRTVRREGRWAGELINRAADGRDYAVWSSISAIYGDSGKVARYMAIQTDLSALKAAQTQVQQLALFDSLTGLPNRALFLDRIRLLMEYALRNQGNFAVVFADLDHFKEVNDTLGHAVGDELLRQAAQRLKGAVRTEDTVARLGGDEFVVLLPGADRRTAHAVAEKLLAALRLPLELGELPLYQPMASAGVAVYPEDGISVDLLLRNADTAMYRAKQAGRNRVTDFNLKMASENEVAFAVQTELAAGIARQELRLHYQPKFDLRSGVLVGAEALVRWQRPGMGLMSPSEFIPVAEKTGLVVEIDRWVLGEALRQVSQWQRAGLWQAPWRIAVNQTARDFRNPEVTQHLHGLLQLHGVAAMSLELEITEGSLLDHTEELIDRLHALRRLGVTLAIDDFGTYYSSLAYLRKLPVQVIKIDKSFVRNMLDNESDRVLVETIVAMAHNLGHQLVAEGIELPAQREQLCALGCETGQGYLLGRPVPPDVFAASHLSAAGVSVAAD
jgi:diguanylate cyclase (GGDEF)-like protein/PAS domain S-box-containing protein